MYNEFVIFAEYLNIYPISWADTKGNNFMWVLWKFIISLLFFIIWSDFNRNKTVSEGRGKKKEL